MERTFAIITPNAFADGNGGKIISRIYEEGFKIVGLKKLYLSKVEAEGFYYVQPGAKSVAAQRRSPHRRR